MLASLPAEELPPAKEFTIVEADLTMRALKNANVRAGPSTAETKVGALSEGSAVNVTGEVEGRDWYRVALADGAEGYVWRPLLSEEEAAPAGPVLEELVTEEPAPAPQLANPSEIVIASGPLLGLTLADWLLLSADRLMQGEYVALIGEAAQLRERYRRMSAVEAVLQQAAMSDLEARKGMARVVYAAAYRRQHGSFDELEANLDEAISIILSSFKPITQSDARASLDALENLKSVSGTTPATLSLKARAYHVLEDYGNAEAAYGAWLNATLPDDAERQQMIVAMLRASKAEPYGPRVGESFRDCAMCPEMVVVPAGEFMMDSPIGEEGRDSDEGPFAGFWCASPSRLENMK